MIEFQEKNADLARQYTYLERHVVRELDGSGNVKKTTIKTYDVTLLEGSPYLRLVAIDDKPLPADRERQEEEKLRKSIEDRSKETPEQRERRIAEWRRKERKQREPLGEVPMAFDFTLAGEEVRNGRTAWIIDAMPKKGYRPKLPFLAKVKCRFWIDKQDYAGVRLEMDTLDAINVRGWLIRLARGSRLMIEQARINDEVWLPSDITLQGSARVLFVKAFRMRLEYTHSAYKKFQVDSRVISGERESQRD